MAYDVKGRLTRVTDALGHKQEVTYNKTYNVRTQIDALGKTLIHTLNRSYDFF
ncbi:MAG: hypothetical protein DRI57_32690 [Deltaproteobacteria bacterium]|nr:MAG: hypothetical protein DRI57_32690 [Deltaproteobacteria bacterium]